MSCDVIMCVHVQTFADHCKAEGDAHLEKHQYDEAIAVSSHVCMRDVGYVVWQSGERCA